MEQGNRRLKRREPNHGKEKNDGVRNEEGLQIMRVLGRNMAWFLKLKLAGEAAGVPPHRNVSGQFLLRHSDCLLLRPPSPPWQSGDGNSCGFR